MVCRENTRGFHPLQLEEGIAQTFLEPLGLHEVIVVDDLHVIIDIFNNCFYSARPRILHLAFEAVLTALLSSDKQLILGLRDRAPNPFHPRCFYVETPRLTLPPL